MRISIVRSGFMLLLATAASSAIAADPAKPVAPPAAAPPPAYVTGFGQSVTGAALATQRGGTDITENSMILNGSVDHNSADNVSTGFNAIGGGAFNGAAGMPTVIQNSGNNVLIQNATIVNVQFKP